TLRSRSIMDFRGPRDIPARQPTEMDRNMTGNKATDLAIRSTLSGFNCLIEQTWDGCPIDCDPISLHMEWLFEKKQGAPHKRAIKCFVTAPFFDDPAPDELPGICPGLWNHEVFEIFLANAKGQYVEVEVGPHGHWLVLLHDGQRKCFNNGEELELNVQNTWVGSTWQCCFEIPLAYLPGGVSKMNAYHIHGPPEERVYKAFSPVTDGTYGEPDFHRLQFFPRFNLHDVVPNTYGATAFNDHKYDSFWEGR
ncbi:hypothetical protein PENTCL1PPCAC_18581, partial [Pristionchus entomophagus]